MDISKYHGIFERLTRRSSDSIRCSWNSGSHCLMHPIRVAGSPSPVFLGGSSRIGLPRSAPASTSYAFMRRATEACRCVRRQGLTANHEH